jgi:hypothetical protein
MAAEHEDTAVAAPPEPRAPKADQALVEARFPERIGFVRRVAYVFTQGSSSYFRVNYMDGNRIDSHWVQVSGGRVAVKPEALSLPPAPGGL